MTEREPQPKEFSLEQSTHTVVHKLEGAHVLIDGREVIIKNAIVLESSSPRFEKAKQNETGTLSLIPYHRFSMVTVTVGREENRGLVVITAIENAKATRRSLIRMHGKSPYLMIQTLGVSEDQTYFLSIIDPQKKLLRIVPKASPHNPANQSSIA